MDEDDAGGEPVEEELDLDDASPVPQPAQTADYKIQNLG